LACSVEVVESLLDASAHRLLTLSDPDSRVKVLLVRLVLTLRVAHRLLQVVVLVLNVVPNTSQVGVLQVGV